MSVLTEVAVVSFRAGYRELVSAVKAAGIVESRRAADRVFLDVSADGGVVVAAAVASQAVNVQLHAEDATPGRLVLGHSALSKALAAAGKGCCKADLDRLQVEISHDEAAGAARLGVDGFTIPLVSLSQDSFPDPILAPPSPVLVDRHAFTAMFGRVRAAASDDARLEVLRCVQVSFDHEGLELLATDRYRASHGRLPADIPAAAAGRQVLLPPVVAKVLPFLDGHEIALGLTEEAVTITASDVTMQLPLPTDDFPNIRHLFPEDTQVQATLNRGQLHRAAVRAAALTAAVGEKLSPVHLRITAGAVTVVPTSPDGPGTAPELAADIAGATDPRVIGLNRDYLVAGITQFPADTITIHTNAPNQPVMLTDDTGTFRHLIMPTRLPS